jgi:WD40 repeat protein
MAETSAVDLIIETFTTSIDDYLSGDISATKMTQEHVDVFRSYYLSNIDNPNAFAIFREIADQLVRTKIDNTTESNVEDVPSVFTIAGKNLYRSFEYNPDNPIIAIGRHQDCQIRLKDYSISRYHLLFIPIPKLRLIVITDIGSLHGFRIIRRSTGKELVSSCSDHRNIAIIDWDEIVVIEISKQSIVLNPKECLICFDKPREVLTKCGHYICCHLCYLQINKCPICRSPITDSIKYDYFFETNPN